MLSQPVSYCYARGCREHIARSLLMCKRHWALVPKLIQDQVYATWRARVKDGTFPWIKAIDQARTAVMQVEDIRGAG